MSHTISPNADDPKSVHINRLPQLLIAVFILSSVGFNLMEIENLLILEINQLSSSWLSKLDNYCTIITFH